jgi:adenylylsulfate kinase
MYRVLSPLHRLHCLIVSLQPSIVNHIYPIKTKVSKEQRERLLNQRAVLIWFTGLSGSGKSTLAVQLEAQLSDLGFKTYLLDGDNIRAGLNKDLSFTDEGRVENIRRIGEVAKLLLDAGVVVLSAFISPFNADRQQVKEIVGANNYVEVFVDAPLELCEQRDVKGLYKKARAGEVKNFTGIDSPYEAPANADVVLNTGELSVEESIKRLMNFVVPKIQFTTEPQRKF